MSIIGNLGRSWPSFSTDQEGQDIKNAGRTATHPKGELSQERITAELESLLKNVDQQLQSQGVSF